MSYVTAHTESNFTVLKIRLVSVSRRAPPPALRRGRLASTVAERPDSYSRRWIGRDIAVS